jgi:mono/diheme cytochrome c family protein
MYYIFTAWLVASGWLVADSHATLDTNPGKHIYSSRCKVCHGEGGDGKSFASGVLNPPPRDFTSTRSKQELTAERMIQSAMNGRPGTAMMAWKDILTNEEIRAVVHFIRQEFMASKDETRPTTKK